MKIANTLPSAADFDALGTGHQTTPRRPQASALTGKLRKAVTDATEWLTGADPEIARARFLSQATDPADLERRLGAWERAQETRRALPPVL